MMTPESLAKAVATLERLRDSEAKLAALITSLESATTIAQVRQAATDAKNARSA
jgi:predicted component of type VI protein secretion system